MRPISLHLEGFGAFRAPTTVDWSAADLFALVGPTGSGKSTLIDAICFALYGSVPRYDDDRAVAPAVSTGANRARVQLDFELSGVHYRAARVVRRTARGATTAEARLERVVGDDVEVVCGQAREMNAAVSELLGMPFAHFTRAVVLPQGQFARFLHDRPADRQKLLEGLLGLDVYLSMGQQARERASAGQAQLEAMAAQRAGMSTSVEDLADAEKRAEALSELTDHVTTELAELDRLSAEATEAESAAAEADDWIGRLESITPPVDLDARADDSAAADAAAAEAQEADRAAREAVAAATADADALPAHATLAELLAAHDRQADLSHRLDERRPALEGLTEAADRAAETLHRAQARIHELRQAHAAHTAAEGLGPGDDCPICGSTLGSEPHVERPAGLDEAERDEQIAQAEVQQARAQLDRAQGELDLLADQLTDIRGRLEGQPGPDEAMAQLEQRRQTDEAVNARRAEQADTAQRLEEVRREVETRRRQAAEEARAFDATRDILAALDPPPRSATVAESWAALTAWATGRSDDLGRSRERAEAAAQTARESARARSEALIERAREAGIEAPAGQLLVELAAARARTDEEIKRRRADIARAEELAEQMTATEATTRVAQELGRLLRAQHFPRWLVTEALTGLVARASDTLGQLTAGRYSLSVDDDASFWVTDHFNADDRRLARTLSGGETFQASLSLALALADQLADLGGGRLGSIFLDEGFGTLDAESLDTVAATIESLGATDRMVGLVTHVPALAERVPTRFVVSKGPHTATVQRVEA